MEKVARLAKEIRIMVTDSLELKEDIADEKIKSLITEKVLEKSGQEYLSHLEKQELVRMVFNSMRGLDVLQPLLDDEEISEVMVNGPEQVFIERNGRIEEAGVVIESRDKLEDMIQGIVAKVNRTVNEASPLVDARLPDGSRVSVVLPPIALNGPILTIRKFPEKTMNMERLVELGTITKEAGDFLNLLVKGRYNIFICGGTGSGKTTLLNALSQFIPADERIVTIEDSAELQISSLKNIVRTEAREANTEGRGRVTIRDLIRMSLRMRPDRIIVGEVRGAEALDMLQAMNTGHDGSLSTGHGNSARDMLKRLETMVLMGASLPLDAIRQQVASAVDVLIHLARLRDKTRRILEITEVLSYTGGQIQLNPLFVFEEEGQEPEGRIIGCLKKMNSLQNTRKLKMAGLSTLV